MNTASIPLRARPLAASPAARSGFLGMLSSLFSGGRRTVPSHGHEADAHSTTGLSRMEPTLPVVGRKDQERVDRAMAAQTAAPSSRRAARLARRDMVFRIVRESMVRAGVLSSGYKFKVLSLDQRGDQFMVMMELASEFGGQTDRLAEIEAMVAQSAKHRHGILVQAVYWRFSDHVVLGRPGSVQPAVAQTGAPVPVVDLCSDAPRSRARYEPLLPDEVMAFKRALEAGSSPFAPDAPRKAPVRTKGSGLLLTGYEDTEVADHDDPLPVLSATQYGDLPLH